MGCSLHQKRARIGYFCGGNIGFKMFFANYNFVESTLTYWKNKINYSLFLLIGVLNVSSMFIPWSIFCVISPKSWISCILLIICGRWECNLLCKYRRLHVKSKCYNFKNLLLYSLLYSCFRLILSGDIHPNPGPTEFICKFYNDYEMDYFNYLLLFSCIMYFTLLISRAGDIQPNPGPNIFISSCLSICHSNIRS